MLLFDTGKKLEKAFTQEQFDALVEAIERREDRAATKDDLRESELRTQLEIEKVRGEVKETEARLRVDIEKVRAEIEKVRAETEKVRAELKVDIQQSKLDTLKWMIGGFVALAAIMAKGFGWIGF